MGFDFVMSWGYLRNSKKKSGVKSSESFFKGYNLKLYEGEMEKENDKK